MEEEGEEVQEYNREVVTVEVDGEAVTEDVEWPGVEGNEGGVMSEARDGTRTEPNAACDRSLAAAARRNRHEKKWNVSRDLRGQVKKN